MKIVLLVKICVPMIQIVERLNAMAVIAVGGRLENAMQKMNRHPTITLAIKEVSTTSSPRLLCIFSQK